MRPLILLDPFVDSVETNCSCSFEKLIIQSRLSVVRGGWHCVTITILAFQKCGIGEFVKIWNVTTKGNIQFPKEMVCVRQFWIFNNLFFTHRKNETIANMRNIESGNNHSLFCHWLVFKTKVLVRFLIRAKKRNCKSGFDNEQHCLALGLFSLWQQSY